MPRGMALRRKKGEGIKARKMPGLDPPQKEIISISKAA